MGEMNFDLRSALPLLLPKAIAWAEERADEVILNGTPLSDQGISIAQRAGVTSPHLIRIAMVDRLPVPSDPQLQQAALATGLLAPNMAGLTLGHSILVCHGQLTIRLLSHECRHVFQYEQAGSIGAFLPLYLQQIVDHGYANAPFEIDARTHEVHA